MIMLIIGISTIMMIMAISLISLQQLVYATAQVGNNFLDRDTIPAKQASKIEAFVIKREAPIAISGDNTYIAWPTNRTGNDEIMFRASTDGGTTFADKINLSNSTDAESQDVEIAADGDNVIVTWWERNETSDEPVARMSNDNGATFGPVLRLATNGIIGQIAATEED